ncbi:hypothetical protein EVAR_32651_1 [Eumeta japonica]|uniref:Uncharacterized protein n=1 Tax=Eumeta variegata TaxID=151549 RepID=A0A4C1WW62_EUMVA|nr:hypothetical protein EVAR_32651_1 [Eumeta japonica]
MKTAQNLGKILQKRNGNKNEITTEDYCLDCENETAVEVVQPRAGMRPSCGLESPLPAAAPRSAAIARDRFLRNLTVLSAPRVVDHRLSPLRSLREYSI